jgi:hypothetical protein
LLSGTNLLNSPYEAAKRLQRESTNLLATSQRFLEYLDHIEQLVEEAEILILTSYEQEHAKIDQISDILIKMIYDYRDQLHAKMTEHMVGQKKALNEH